MVVSNQQWWEINDYGLSVSHFHPFFFFFFFESFFHYSCSTIWARIYLCDHIYLLFILPLPVALLLCPSQHAFVLSIDFLFFKNSHTSYICFNIDSVEFSIKFNFLFFSQINSIAYNIYIYMLYSRKRQHWYIKKILSVSLLFLLLPEMYIWVEWERFEDGWACTHKVVIPWFFCETTSSSFYFCETSTGPPQGIKIILVSPCFFTFSCTSQTFLCLSNLGSQPQAQNPEQHNIE